MPTTVIRDTFCGPSGIDIAGRAVAPVNAPRAAWQPFGGSAFLTDGNRATLTLIQGQGAEYRIDPGLTPATLSVTIVALSGTGNWAAGFRFAQVDAKNYFELIYDGDTSTWDFSQFVNGTKTPLNSKATPVTTGQVAVAWSANGIDVTLPDGEQWEWLAGIGAGTQVELWAITGAPGSLVFTVTNFAVYTNP
jgi:hypothetical protein